MKRKEANRIVFYRNRIGLTQKQLAEKLKTSQQQIQRIESGKQSPRYDLALQICAALKAPISKVFPKTQFAITELKTAAKKKHKDAPPSSIAGALLADGADLDLWATRLDAYAKLPVVVRQLALYTNPSIEQIHFRADEGTRLEGWDGLIQARHGDAFVPAGISAWELGTNKDVKAKADEDYSKRTAVPGEVSPPDTTFIFGTPRRWSGKEKWAAEKRKDGIWKDVRALDGDDLVTWLEQARAVHVWLSGVIGKRPSGLRDLLGFWHTWSEVTVPALRPELLTASRNEAAEQIMRFFKEQPAVLELRGETREEAVAFVGAVVLGMPERQREDILAKSIVVDNSAAWRQLAGFHRPLVLIPTFTERKEAADALSAGHFLIIPLGRGEAASPGVIELPRLKREESQKAFEAMGLSSDRSQEMAGIARRSINALRRKLAISPSLLTPAWATPTTGRALLPALLAGQWNDRNSDDQRVIGQLAGREYRDVREVLVQWSNEQEPPVLKVGDTQMFASKEDGWSLLSRYITRDDMRRFEVAVLEVLSERDPKYDLPLGERWCANLYGKVRKHSGILREGLAETLAIMATYSDLYRIDDTWTPQEWATHIVRKLFDQEMDTNMWASLSPLLRLLAEAAPEVVLSVIEADLAKPEPCLLGLFTDKEDSFFESSAHTDLLRALEVLAWSRDYLAPSVLALAKLARLEPGGKLLNRPLRSLREIFLSWHPGTSANLEQRLKVLDRMRKYEPKVAWDVLASILPQSMDSAHPTAKPKWRDWVPDKKPSITWPEFYKATEQVVKWLLEDVGTDGARWKTLIDAIPHMRKTEFDAVVGRLQAVDLLQLPRNDCIQIWDGLRDIISRHLQFPDAKWALPPEAVDRLQEAYVKFEPSDPLTKRAWLFSHNPELPEAGYSEWEERERAINERKVRAVNELAVEHGLGKVCELAGTVKAPWHIGWALARSNAADGREIEILTQCLGSANHALRQMGSSFLIERTSLKGTEWRDSLRTSKEWQNWTPQHRVDYFLSLPFTDRNTWDVLEKEDPEAQRLYWSQVGPYGHGDLDMESCEKVLRKFVEYGRLGTAIDFMYLNAGRTKKRLQPKLVAEVLQKVRQGADTETVQWGSHSHHISELLDFLAQSGEVDDSTMAELEWFFLPLLRYDRPPKTLHQALATDAQFFVGILKLMYRGEGEDSAKISEEQKLRARLGYDLLSNWKLPPGLNKDGTISPGNLGIWVTKARELALACGRAKVADHHIGNVLAHSPAGTDQAWPHEAVRELLEDVASEDIEEGLRIGIYNSRGVVGRSLREGGALERAIADRYRKYAQILSPTWPRTARLMKQIAEGYESEARREDIEAEMREDLWD